LATLVALLSVGIVAPAMAAPPDPATLCKAAKLLAVGAEARARLFCEQREIATGDTTDCIVAASTRRDDAFARADASGRCAVTGDSNTLHLAVNALLLTVLPALRPGGPTASRCTAAELGDAGRAIASLVRAYVRDARRPDPTRLADDVAAAKASFARAFARAVAKSDCVTSTDADTVFAILAQAAAGFRDLLSPRCGNGVVDGGEACEGTTCPSAGDPEPDGCFPAGSSNECQCCANETPCYIRGGGAVLPVEIPCCSGVCNIPGPDAGPNVTVYCTPPVGECPCWTSAGIDAVFPPGFFDANGRGGALCNVDGTATSLGAADSCTLFGPGGLQFVFPRGGVAVLAQNVCVAVPDLDPGNSGSCNGTPTVLSTTPAQTAACTAALHASAAYQAACP
jgi:hypothetical protein